MHLTSSGGYHAWQRKNSRAGFCHRYTTQAHVHGHMAWKNIDLHVAYYNRRRISTLLAGAISDTFAVSR